MTLDPETLNFAARDPKHRAKLEVLLVDIRREAEKAEALACTCEREAWALRIRATQERAREAQIVEALSTVAV